MQLFGCPIQTSHRFLLGILGLLAVHQLNQSVIVATEQRKIHLSKLKCQHTGETHPLAKSTYLRTPEQVDHTF